eukprot:jgi/Tetstr1/431739/TSEL_002228.t1
MQGLLYRQVLDLEEALRRRANELGEARKALEAAERERHLAQRRCDDLQGKLERQSADDRSEMWTLGRLVDSQKQEIKKLQSQLGREKERCSRAREVAKCPLVGDPDWPEQLDEQYLVGKVPLGARTFVSTLLQHVRAVQRVKESKLSKLRDALHDMDEAYKQERGRADQNARLAAQLHREVERLRSAQMTTRPTPAQPFSTPPVPDHTEYLEGDGYLCESAAISEVERTTERIQTLLSSSQCVLPGAGAHAASYSSPPAAEFAPHRASADDVESPATPGLGTYMPLPSYASPGTPVTDWERRDFSSAHVEGEAWEPPPPISTFHCQCKQDAPPLLYEYELP